MARLTPKHVELSMRSTSLWADDIHDATWKSPLLDGRIRMTIDDRRLFVKTVVISVRHYGGLLGPLRNRWKDSVFEAKGCQLIVGEEMYDVGDIKIVFRNNKLRYVEVMDEQNLPRGVV